MDRINHSTATPDRKFTAGNPATPIPATVMTPEFANAVQEELCNVIEGAGLSLDPADDTQLLAAVNAHIVAALLGVSTPPQFDASTKLATSAFVQQALGSNNAFSSLAGATTLTAAYAGRFIQLSGTLYTTTLPLGSACANGSRLEFLNSDGTNAKTVSRQGTDVIYDPTGGTVTSLALHPGDTLLLESYGTGAWYVLGGSVALKYASGAFGASIAAAGYQKLPSGLIFQWGAWNPSSTPGAAVAVTFPLAFPAACYGVALGANYTSSVTTSAWKDTLTTTGFQGRCNVSTGDNIHYWAIGR